MSNLITFGLGRGVTTPTGTVLYDLSVLREPRVYTIEHTSNNHEVVVQRTQYTLCNRETIVRTQ